MSERGKMQVNDWMNAGVNVVIGVFLGIAAASLMRLATTVFWPLAILIPIVVAGLLLFEGLLDGIANKIFPSGIRPARKSTEKRRTPLPRLLSLPVGIVLGVVLSWFGLGERLLGVI